MHRRHLPMLAMWLLLAFPASAQCENWWFPSIGTYGTNGTVQATTMWDPDGGGPLPAVLVIGGSFTVAGNVLANNIASHDFSTGTWTTLGTGINGTVSCLGTLATGELVVGGFFALGGGGYGNLAKWNGTTWSSIGTGVNGLVRCLATRLNGDLVVGGTFTIAGGVTANRIARWDGTNWFAFGGGANGIVNTLATLANGDLVAGGNFTSIAGVAASCIARWTGATWLPMGTGMNGAVTSAIPLFPGAAVVVGGYFTTAGGVTVNRVALWSGSFWNPIGSGVDGPVLAMARLVSGEYIAAGTFTSAGGVMANNIARYNGTWSALGSGLISELAPGTAAGRTVTALPTGGFVAGGQFDLAGTSSGSSIAQWTGTAWSVLGPQTNGDVRALIRMPNGDLVAGGDFTVIGGASANRIARWNGQTWSAMGGGMDGAVHALSLLPNGDLVAGGTFMFAGGTPVAAIARWDGASWSALGSGATGTVLALVVLANGDLVAGGGPGVVERWDGVSWSTVGFPLPWQVLSLVQLANGDLVSGGHLGSVVRWDGVTWSLMGTGMNGPVHALVVRANGDLIAGGGFTTAGGVSALEMARWGGANWVSVGAPLFGGGVSAFVSLPNGDLMIGGGFVLSLPLVTSERLARWDGTTWYPVWGGPGPSGSAVRALATLTDGDLAMGGSFQTIGGGIVSPFIAGLTTTCPAVSSSYGVGCTGSGGPNVLTAATLPWIGSTFRATGTGMPALAFVGVVTGFAPTSLPLSVVLPQGQPGCDLLVTPDLLDFVLPTAGSAQSQLALPNTVTLAGLQFRQQMVPLEVDLSLNVTAVTSSNALLLTVGSF